MAKKKKPKTWMLTPPKQTAPKSPIPERIKADLDARAKKLVENVLRPSALRR